MSDLETPEEPSSSGRFREPVTVRCPTCDSVVTKGDKRCLMCGASISADLFVEAAARAAKDALRAERERLMSQLKPVEETAKAVTPNEEVAEIAPAIEEIAEVVTTNEADESPVPTPPSSPSKIRTAVPLEERIQTMPRLQPVPAVPQGAAPWRPSPFFALVVLMVVVFSVCGGLLVVNAEQTAVAAQTATARPTETTPTVTPTLTETPTPTSTPSPTLTSTPTETPTPAPTNTPQPPRFHAIEQGQTMISLALIYDVTLDSLLKENPNLNPSLIQQGQQIQIPWPTATPPLQAIAVEIGEEYLVVDPSVCPPFYEIKEGDSIFAIAAQNRVPFEAMMQLNYLTMDSIVRPGDLLCIPRVLENAVLPPTPGPSPTPSLTPAPQGAQLLYPAPETTVDTPNDPIALQWVAVKDLTAEEWYMVVVTDLSDVDAHPWRGFTRQNSFQLPASWRPNTGDLHHYEWKVSIVQVTGQRQDGSFIYTYGGRTSQPSTFWVR